MSSPIGSPSVTKRFFDDNSKRLSTAGNEISIPRSTANTPHTSVRQAASSTKNSALRRDTQPVQHTNEPGMIAPVEAVDPNQLASQPVELKLSKERTKLTKKEKREIKAKIKQQEEEEEKRLDEQKQKSARESNLQNINWNEDNSLIQIDLYPKPEKKKKSSY